MRPKNLKPPCTASNKKIMVYDRVWFVPTIWQEHVTFEFPGWSHSSFFGEDRPLNIEYCSGNGDWIADKAEAHPDMNWLAVELKFDRVRKIWSKLKNRSLSNLMIVCGEGHAATSQFFPSNCVHSVYINFPDPWPKTRHSKHRLIQPQFLEEVNRILHPNGKFFVATDDLMTSERLIQLVSMSTLFNSLMIDGCYTQDCVDYGNSYFQNLWIEKGKSIRYHSFIKNS